MVQKSLFISLLSLFFFTYIHAQNIDSVRVVRDTLKKNTPSLLSQKKDSAFVPNPKKALLYSIIPGGGQIYNRKALYIRLPLVYGALGGSVFYTRWSAVRYKLLRDVYASKAKGEKNFPTNLPSSYPKNVVAQLNAQYSTISPDFLKRNRDNFFTQTQRAYAFMAITYILTAAEAFTTAHLLNFDVSEDISMHIKPNFQYMPYGTASGVGLAFTF
jgi:hypothetical protein